MSYTPISQKKTDKIFEKMRDERYAQFGGKENYQRAMKEWDGVLKITDKVAQELVNEFRNRDALRAKSNSRGLTKVIR